MPGLNRVMRRQVRDLYTLCAGFAYSQTLRACVQLDIFGQIAGAPPGSGLDIAVLAERVSVPEHRLLPLVEGACALGLLRWRADGSVGLSMNGAAVLADPGIAAMVAHHDLLYQDIADPAAFLRDSAGAQMRDFWGYLDASPERAAAYSDVMARSQAMVSRFILGALPLRAVERMADVGGGTGTFLRAVNARAPHIDLHLYDLSHVADLAESRNAAEGLADAITCHGQDFTSLTLQPDIDLVTLVRVMHDQNDPQAADLLARLHGQMRPGSRLVIAETFRETPGAEAIGASYFSMFLLGMGRGRLRSRAELYQLLAGAGFRQMREHRSAVPEVVRVISARC